MYRNDVVFEVLQKIIHLTLIDRVNTNLRYHFIFLQFAYVFHRSDGTPWKLSECVANSQPNLIAPFANRVFCRARNNLRLSYCVVIGRIAWPTMFLFSDREQPHEPSRVDKG